jgi:hypothetical protein
VAKTIDAQDKSDRTAAGNGWKKGMVAWQQNTNNRTMVGADKFGQQTMQQVRGDR